MELAEGRVVIELSPDDDDERARFVLADVLIDLGRLDRAREVADDLTRSDFAQLLRGRIPDFGAFPCMGFLEAKEYAEFLAPYHIHLVRGENGVWSP